MKLFRDFRAERNINRALALSEFKSQEARKTLLKLKDSADIAVPRLLQMFTLSSQADKTRLEKLLHHIVDNMTLNAFCRTLRDNELRTVPAIVEILSTNQRFDPNLLLEYLDDPSMPKTALLDVLSAHVDQIDGHALLRRLGALDLSDRHLAFVLLEKIADETLLPELINRASAKDLQIRQGVARLLGKRQGIHPLDA